MKQQLTELYRTPHGLISQDNKRYGYHIEWMGQTTFLKMPWFFSLKRQVEALDIETFLLASHEVEILSACGCERVFILTAQQALEFKQLFAGARHMMELNSLLHECLNRRAIFA